MDEATLASGSLHIDVRGGGPDLVLLHGWGFDHRVWGPFAEALTHRLRLHLVDLPGHGRSRALPFGSLDDVVASIAERVPAGATVCGWSLGGLLAMRLALQRPDRVRRLALIATTPCFAQAEGWALGVPHPMLEGFRNAMAQDGASARRGFATLVAHGSADARAQSRTLAALCDSGSPPDWASLRRALAALHAADLRPEAGNIAAPTLVLHGDRDAVIAAAAGRWLADHLGGNGRGPRPAFKRIESAGHAPFLDAPHDVAQAILDWHG